MKRLIYLLLFFGLVLNGCAVIGSLDGGPDDVIGPKLIREKSTASFQTNFSEREIVLTFDEWVKLGQVNTLIMSPPLDHKPKLKIKGKSVIFQFDSRDTLAKDVTYSIQFGKSIVDITKNNPAKDITYVFSTGDYIDSLSIQGSVNVIDQKLKLEDISVLMYKLGLDSLVKTQKPIYRVKVDGSGVYNFNYIKAGKYNIYGLDDKNKNGFYDDGEGFGFLDSLVQISPKSTTINKILVYNPVLDFDVIDEDFDKSGIDKLTFSYEIDSIKWQYIPKPENISFLKGKEKMMFWHDQTDTVSYDIVIDQVDTIHVKGRKRKVRDALSVISKKIKLNPFLNKNIVFNLPISAIDTSKMYFKGDSTQVLPRPLLVLDSLNIKRCLIQNNLSKLTNWELVFEPNSLIDFWGEANEDTIVQQIELLDKDGFGDIAVQIDSIQIETDHLICKLIKDEAVIKVVYLDLNEPRVPFVFKKVEGGEYILEVVLDSNGNKRWDTGDFENRKQPEEIIKSSSITLRKGWDIEFDMSDMFKNKIIETEIIDVEVETGEELNKE